MKRTRTIYSILFVASAGVLFAAMAWLTATALRIEDARLSAERMAAVEEALRLALWRMDSSAIALLVTESARPQEEYTAAAPGPELATAGISGNTPPDTQAGAARLVRVRFETDTAGRIMPLAFSNEEQAKAAPASKEQLLLAELEKRIGSVSIADAFTQQSTWGRGRANAFPVVAEAAVADPSPGLHVQQQALSQNDFAARNQQAVANLDQVVSFNNTVPWVSEPSQGSPVGLFVETAMQPFWVHDELLLARRVREQSQVKYQGCWMDWPALKLYLERSAGDVMAGIRVEPSADADEGTDPGRMMAALPLRVVPGQLIIARDEPWPWAMIAMLAMAWFSVSLAVLAMGFALNRALALSERRAAFVSAVTHELRTPLTTFRMYAEMLAEGIVRDESKRCDYLRTLQTEADRLVHLVENVLAYSRLERTRRTPPLEAIRVDVLFERCSAQIAARADAAGMIMAANLDPALDGAVITTAPAVVEQILMNLTDNACKYARGAEDRRIHLDMLLAKESVTVQIRDHGPGIPERRRRGLFRAFSKSATEAANSAPGIGLGLALSHRLARSLGGKLRLAETADEGACFELTLPLVPKARHS